MRVFTKAEQEAFFATLNKTPKGSNVAIENEKGELLVLKANYKTQWCLPGGWCDEGESPREGAVREVQEETGLVVAPEDLELQTMLHRVSSSMRSDLYIWKVRLPLEMDTKIIIQPEEIDEYVFVSSAYIKNHPDIYNPQVRAWAEGFPDRYGEYTIKD